VKIRSPQPFTNRSTSYTSASSSSNYWY